MKLTLQHKAIGLTLLTYASCLPVPAFLSKDYKLPQSSQNIEKKSILGNPEQSIHTFFVKREEQHAKKDLTPSEINSKRFKLAFILAGIHIGYLVLLSILESIILVKYRDYATSRQTIIDAEQAIIQEGANIQPDQDNEKSLKEIRWKIFWCKVAGIFVALPYIPILFVLSIPAFLLISTGSVAADLDEEELTGNGVPLKKNLPADFIISRADIDSYVPKFNAQDVESFDYLDPDKSFNKILTVGEVKILSTTEGGNFIEKIEKDSSCTICLSHYEDDNTQLMLLPCGHHLHNACISEYRVANIARFNGALAENRSFKCFLCQLPLLNQFLYYKEQGYPLSVKFVNKT